MKVRGAQQRSSAHAAQPERGLDAALTSRGATALARTCGLPHFTEVVTRLGGDPVALLRRAQIDPAAVDDREARIPYSQMVDVFETAAIELGCPDFGMRRAAAQAAQGATKMLGPLDVAMRNAPTLGAAFRFCGDYIHAYNSAAQVSFEKLPDDPRIFMLFEVAAAGLHQRRQAMEYALAITQHAFHALSGGQARAREVWFTHEPLAPASAYRTHFNAPVRFGQSVNGLIFDEDDFNLPAPGADPQLYEIATSFIADRFPSAEASLSRRVRISIARLLVEGRCTHEQVAATLRLHPRTLQRRLREEGESFEAIKDSVRRDVALRYLQQPDISLVRVTELLGYSETSVLSRSCLRWFSASPSELRSGLQR